MKHRRRAFKLLLFLLALLVGGAIINVAVAWTLKLSTDAMSAEPETISAHAIDLPTSWFVMRYRKPGSVVFGAMQKSTESMLIDDSRVPAWSRMRDLPAHEQGTAMMTLFDFGFGWPAISMWHGFDARRDAASGALTAIQAPGSLGPFALPLRPIFPGFAINTIFYAAIVWIVFAVPGAVRRRLRHKRGQCASCGYSLRGTPHVEKCPECGCALKQKAEMPSAETS